MSHESQELVLFIENDGDLYRQQLHPIQKNLANKMAQGKYDHTKAVKLWMYLMDNGAKKYAKEFASAGEWNKIFSVADRKAAAKEFALDFEANWKAGEYRHLLTKASFVKMNVIQGPPPNVNRSGSSKPRPLGSDRDKYHGNPNARKSRNRSGRTARAEWLQAKDHAKRVIAALRADGARLKQHVRTELVAARAALRADGARLKQHVRTELVAARDRYRITVTHLKDRLRQWKVDSGYQIAAERTNVRRLRGAVEAHVTTGQRVAGQRLNERFHEAMGAAERAIGHMHPELVPSFRRWNNSAEARRAFSRAVKKLGQRRGVHADAIGDAVAVEFMQDHVASYSDAMQHANETIEQCVQRAEKRIAQLQIADPYEYEQEAARIWNECSARAS